MITRVTKLDRAWVRAALVVYLENTTIDEISDRIKCYPDGGGLLRSEVAQAQFDADLPLCGWILRSRIEPSAPADRHIEDLLDRLAGAQSRLRALVAEGALVEFVICVLGDDFAVPLSLTSTNVKRLAEIPASLRVFFTGERKFVGYSASLVFEDHYTMPRSGKQPESG